MLSDLPKVSCLVQGEPNLKSGSLDAFHEAHSLSISPCCLSGRDRLVSQASF